MKRTISKLPALINDVGQWARNNFGNTPVTCFKVYQDINVSRDIHRSGFEVELDWLAPLLGIGEEIGELMECNPVTQKVEATDALGDTGIYFCDYMFRRHPTLDYAKFAEAAMGVDKIRFGDIVERRGFMVSCYGKLIRTELKYFQKIRGMADESAQRESNLEACKHLYCSIELMCNQVLESSAIDVIEKVFTETVGKRDWKKNSTNGE